MSLRILIVDDEPDSVEPLCDELNEKLDVLCKVVSFEEAQGALNEFRPAAVFLDLLKQDAAGTSEMVGDEVYGHIWSRRFCPLIVYSAASHLLQIVPHPFVQIVTKGGGSEERAVEALQSMIPQIIALDEIETDIGEVLQSVLRELAPRVYSDSAPPELLTRAARRQIAARMDFARGEGSSLAPWEQYIFPPVLPHLCTGDLLVSTEADEGTIDPDLFRIVLSPSCDLVCVGDRKARVKEVLVAKCRPSSRLLEALQVSNPKKAQGKLRKVLTQGFFEGLVPLPEFSDLVPEMCADLRCLELIDLDEVCLEGGHGRFRRVVSVDSPFRELITWAFVQTAARPGLPDRDWAAWAKAISPDRDT